jgi:hypothetical protein
MCKAPKPPKVKPPEKPEFLHNNYLDAAVGQSAIVSGLRTGRSSLRIPLGSGLNVTGALDTSGIGRQPGEVLAPAARNTRGIGNAPPTPPTAREMQQGRTIDYFADKYGLQKRK